ncbi:MAG: DUF4919 domain-containing protein [Alphaproteobacteria bacterium]
MHKVNLPVVLFLVALLGSGSVAAQTPQPQPGAAAPEVTDKFESIKVLARQLQQEKTPFMKLVSIAESDNKKVNFNHLRRSFLFDNVFQRVWVLKPEIDALRQEMIYAAQANDHVKVRVTSRLLLTVKYPDIQAHKLLAAACVAAGWRGCAEHHNLIYLGLLNSVVKDGDGKTCATAWKVFSVDEENAILETMRMRRMRHEYVILNNKQCDEVRVSDSGGTERNFYFDISEMPNEERAVAGLK